jgi:CheY-like chemotaxis protein
MPNTKASLLVVDDDLTNRETLSDALAESGYRVRSAEDGFSALVEMRDGIPDIILSDLNMPGMSGFELISLVRSQFPTVYVIAMSGAYSGNGVPPGVAADAFYEKGTSLPALLRIMETMSRAVRARLLHSDGALAHIWIPGNGHHPSGKPFVVITCTECFRTFAQVLGEDIHSVCQTQCVNCRSSIHYAIVEPIWSAFLQPIPRNPSNGTPTPLGLLNIY